MTCAHPLSAAQVTELKQQLRQRIGRDVAVELNVDKNLLGGLVVRIGSPDDRFVDPHPPQHSRTRDERLKA